MMGSVWQEAGGHGAGWSSAESSYLICKLPGVEGGRGGREWGEGEKEREREAINFLWS